MQYFRNVKKDDDVFSLVFGLGVVSEVFDKNPYKLRVKFINSNYKIFYTDEGIPNWGKFKHQTLFFKDDIDLSDYDFSAITEVLSAKKIIKLRDEKRLQVRLPSGIWCDIKKNVREYSEEMFEKQMHHLFRKRAY